MKANALTVLTVLSLGLFACKSSKLVLDEADGDKPSYKVTEEQKAMLSYEYVKQNVFSPKCISCHGNSGGLDLANYETTAAKIVKIKQEVFVTKTMPQKDSLNDEQQAMLWAWIDMGAPKDSAINILPPVPKLTGTFESISKLIFDVKCVTCHAKDKSVPWILLDRPSILDSPRILVDKDNVDESGLLVAINRTDNKRMPPPRDGYSALTEAEKAAIYDWILSETKDVQKEVKDDSPPKD